MIPEDIKKQIEDEMKLIYPKYNEDWVKEFRSHSRKELIDLYRRQILYSIRLNKELQYKSDELKCDLKIEEDAHCDSVKEMKVEIDTWKNMYKSATEQYAVLEKRLSEANDTITQLKKFAENREQ